MWNQAIGRKGEDIAANYLASLGVQIIAKNFRSAYGEIDLIGVDHDDLVFFEVKTRTSLTYGPPEMAVTAKKFQRMVNCAQYYVQENKLELDWRIDVLAVSLDKKTNQSSIEWIKNVTEAN
jgi:putative endonuclease